MNCITWHISTLEESVLALQFFIKCPEDRSQMYRLTVSGTLEVCQMNNLQHLSGKPVHRNGLQLSLQIVSDRRLNSHLILWLSSTPVTKCFKLGKFFRNIRKQFVTRVSTQPILFLFHGHYQLSRWPIDVTIPIILNKM